MPVGREPEDFPGKVLLLRGEFPGDVSRELVDPAPVPAGWHLCLGPETLQDLGGAWVRRGRTCARVVPSVIVSRERNRLLNPDDPGLAACGWLAPSPLHRREK